MSSAFRARLLLAVLLANGCAPDCTSEKHVPVEIASRQIDDPGMWIFSHELLDAGAVHQMAAFRAVNLTSKCYWYVVARPKQGTAVQRRGEYLFDALTGKLVSLETTIVHVDRFRSSPTPAP